MQRNDPTHLRPELLLQHLRQARPKEARLQLYFALKLKIEKHGQLIKGLVCQDVDP